MLKGTTMNNWVEMIKDLILYVGKNFQKIPCIQNTKNQNIELKLSVKRYGLTD